MFLSVTTLAEDAVVKIMKISRDIMSDFVPKIKSKFRTWNYSFKNV